MNGVSWIKLDVHLFSHPKIRHVSRLPFGDKAVLIWIFLLTIAGQCNEDGKIYLAPGTPYTSTDLALEFGVDEVLIDEIIALFLRLKMLVRENDGVLTVCNWSKYQSVDRLAEIREYNRLAKQRERERKKEDVIDKSLTSQPRKEKKRKDKKTPPKPPSDNVADYVAHVEEVIKCNGAV